MDTSHTSGICNQKHKESVETFTLYSAWDYTFKQLKMREDTMGGLLSKNVNGFIRRSCSAARCRNQSGYLGPRMRCTLYIWAYAQNDYGKIVYRVLL